MGIIYIYIYIIFIIIDIYLEFYNDDFRYLYWILTFREYVLKDFVYIRCVMYILMYNYMYISVCMGFFLCVS